MPKQEAPLQALNDFLPPGSFEMVKKYLREHKVHLTITRARISVLGDYRNAMDGRNHRITVNGNLNPYAFLITLLHELAHLLNFMSFGNRVQPHGKEWKNCFARLLVDFKRAGIFPPDIYQALSQSFRDPAASSCTDDNLIRVLRNYDAAAKRSILLEQLANGNLFTIPGGRIFRKGERIRKRFQCLEVKTGRLYLFSPVYEVMPVVA
jgi:SprT protein